MEEVLNKKQLQFLSEEKPAQVAAAARRAAAQGPQPGRTPGREPETPLGVRKDPIPLQANPGRRWEGAKCQRTSPGRPQCPAAGAVPDRHALMREARGPRATPFPSRTADRLPRTRTRCGRRTSLFGKGSPARGGTGTGSGSGRTHRHQQPAAAGQQRGRPHHRLSAPPLSRAPAAVRGQAWAPSSAPAPRLVPPSPLGMRSPPSSRPGAPGAPAPLFSA